METADLPYDFCSFVAAQRGITRVETFSLIRAWAESVRTTIPRQGAGAMRRPDVAASQDEGAVECS
jgi:hypothetical protein